jgi:hypothetical protein
MQAKDNANRSEKPSRFSSVVTVWSDVTEK